MDTISHSEGIKSLLIFLHAKKGLFLSFFYIKNMTTLNQPMIMIGQNGEV